MKPEEAIKKLDRVTSKYNDCFYCEGHTDEEWQAVDMAMKALEKQIPKEPIFTTDGDYDCPVCSAKVYSFVVGWDGIIEMSCDYCPNCGQKIDWSEE